MRSPPQFTFLYEAHFQLSLLPRNWNLLLRAFYSRSTSASEENRHYCAPLLCFHAVPLLLHAHLENCTDLSKSKGCKNNVSSLRGFVCCAAMNSSLSSSSDLMKICTVSILVWKNLNILIRLIV